MIEKEHGLHTSYLPGVGRRDISDVGVVKDKAVVADNLYIGILLQQPKLLGEWGVQYTELTFTFGSDGRGSFSGSFSNPPK